MKHIVTSEKFSWDNCLKLYPHVEPDVVWFCEDGKLIGLALVEGASMTVNAGVLLQLSRVRYLNEMVELMPHERPAGAWQWLTRGMPSYYWETFGVLPDEIVGKTWSAAEDGRVGTPELLEIIETLKAGKQPLCRSRRSFDVCAKQLKRYGLIEYVDGKWELV